MAPLEASAAPRSATALTSDDRITVLEPVEQSWETSLAISPVDPRIMVAAGQRLFADRRGTAYRSVAFRSEDGGKTWSEAKFIPFPADRSESVFSTQGDGVIAVDRRGIFYYATIVYYTDSQRSSLTHTGITVSRSTDGGQTWDTAVKLSSREIIPGQPRPFDDKDWIVVDTSGGPRDGTVYVAWQYLADTNRSPIPSQMVISKSADQGLTWTEPQPIEGLNTANSGAPNLAIGPDGALYATRWDGSGINIYYTIWMSADGGDTWGPKLRGPNMSLYSGILPYSQWNAHSMQSFVVDASDTSHRGRLYYVYPAGVGRSGTRQPAGVVFSYSTDRGLTWSGGMTFAGPDLKHDALQGSVAADPITGDVIVTWLDRRDDPANALARVWGARSRDGGETFDPEIPLSPPFPIDAKFIGDYRQGDSRLGLAVFPFSDGPGAMSVARASFDAGPALSAAITAIGGDPFALTLAIANRGQTATGDVTASLQGGDPAPLGAIGAWTVATVSFPFVLDPAVPCEGRLALKLTVQFDGQSQELALRVRLTPGDGGTCRVSL